jgi:hypothetical protein
MHGQQNIKTHNKVSLVLPKYADIDENNTISID